MEPVAAPLEAVRFFGKGFADKTQKEKSKPFWLDFHKKLDQVYGAARAEGTKVSVKSLASDLEEEEMKKGRKFISWRRRWMRKVVLPNFSKRASEITP